MTAGSGGSASPLPASGSGIRTFGVWLDDASVAAPGGGWVSLSLGYYKTDLFREIDAPMADAGLGLSRRVQLGFSLPVYNVTPLGGVRAHGIGDLYLHSKIQLRDPVSEANGVGFAVLPIIEALSEPAAGQRRLNWALPVSLEVRREGWRAYGSAGYFSRGSLFASMAVERAISPRLSLTGTFSDSYSTKADPAAAILGLARSRADVSGGASYALGPEWIVFGSIGRTVSAHDRQSAKLSLVGGVSLNLAAPRQSRPRTQKRK
ncbi:MAG TPA: hypothetical protein VF921_03310 [Vicinamibacterales bacterium]